MDESKDQGVRPRCFDQLAAIKSLFVTLLAAFAVSLVSPWLDKYTVVWTGVFAGCIATHIAYFLTHPK